MSKMQKDLLLVIGTAGIVATLFTLLMSLLTIFKISKLTLLCLGLISSIVFFEGLASSIQKRIKETARFHFQRWWRKLDGYVNQTLFA